VLLLLLMSASCRQAGPGASGDRKHSRPAILLLSGEPVSPDTHAIFLPKTPRVTERTAAEELQRHLLLITGNRLEILDETNRGSSHGFYVGRCTTHAVPEDQLASLGSDGLIIETRGHDLVLAGNTRGVLYAVSVFLEDYLGVRWLAYDWPSQDQPAPECTTFPRHGTIRVEQVSRRYIPPLAYRDTDIRYYFRHPEPARIADRQFAMRLRLNGQYSGLDASHGGTVSFYPLCHSFGQLVPVNEYFDKHPEYYSLIGGERRREKTQLCLANKDVLAIAKARVRQWIHEHPEATYIDVSQNDAPADGYWCECEACRALTEKEGGRSGPLLHFINAIADDIRNDHPDKMLTTLAYQDTRHPPRVVRPRPNVAIRLCAIECCYSHPLESCEVNRPFVRDLEGWRRICDHVTVWDYSINFCRSFLPFPNLYVIKPNIKLFVANGVKGVYEQGDYYSTGHELEELRTYVIARTLWNPDCDTDAAIDEFLTGYYGPAAPMMREYVNLVHEKAREGKGPHVGVYAYEYIPADFVSRAQPLFAAARRIVKDAPILTRRVRRAHLPVIYLRLMKGACDYSQEGDMLVDVDVPGVNDWAEEFRRTVEAERITCIGEHVPIAPFLDQLKPSPVRLKIERLSNGQVELELLPGYGGRILRFRDRRSNVNWTRVFGSGGRIRAADSGIEDFSGTKYQSPGWCEAYEIVERTPLSMTMRGTLSNGLEMERRVTLAKDAPVLRVRSTLRNRTQEPQVARLRVHPTWEINDPERARLVWRPAAGEWQTSPLPRSTPDAADGNRWFKAEARPAEWGLVDDASGAILMNRVLGGDVESCYCWADWREKWVTLELWSPERILQPEQSMSIEYEYELR